MKKISIIDDSPSPNGGRDNRGRFTKQNSGGPGNPHSGDTARLRSALLSAVTEKDVKIVAQKLLARAKGGDIRAIKELLDRLLGKSSPTLESIEAEERGNQPPMPQLIEVIVETEFEKDQFILARDLLARLPDSIKP